MESAHSTSNPIVNGGVTQHNFGNDDIVIVTGKKAGQSRDYECFVISLSVIKKSGIRMITRLLLLFKDL